MINNDDEFLVCKMHHVDNVLLYNSLFTGNQKINNFSLVTREVKTDIWKLLGDDKVWLSNFRTNTGYYCVFVFLC